MAPFFLFFDVCHLASAWCPSTLQSFTMHKFIVSNSLRYYITERISILIIATMAAPVRDITDGFRGNIKYTVDGSHLRVNIITWRELRSSSLFSSNTSQTSVTAATVVVMTRFLWDL